MQLTIMKGKNSYRKKSKNYQPWPQKSKNKAKRWKRGSQDGKRGQHQWPPHLTDEARTRHGSLSMFSELTKITRRRHEN